VECARLVREHFPTLPIVARARNVTHYYQLRQLGVVLIERETLDSALLSARSVLEILGLDPLSAQASAERFRAHTIELMEQMAPHFGDEAKLIAIARLGRQQFEEMWALEREDRARALSAQAIPQQLAAGEQQAQVEQPVEQGLGHAADEAHADPHAQRREGQQHG
jgi:glutathione-regulated potassium-efflux system ancillary protein KefC